MNSATRAVGRVIQHKTAIRPASSCQSYHSYDRPLLPPYGEPQASILAAAIQHVPRHGFSQHALDLGIQDANFPGISSNLFSRNSFDLIQYYLSTQRLALKDKIQFPRDNIGVGRKVRSLILERLRANVEHGVVGQWQGALATMSLAENIAPSIQELNSLADEIWFLAGDTSVDASWYTKRLTLAGVYAATEVYQTSDQSTDYRDTEMFLDRRLAEVRALGNFVGGATQWAIFQSGAFVNLLRSKGLRI